MACILVVDGDEDTREAISQVLTDDGFLVRTARDAEAAVRSAGEANAPAMILLDVGRRGSPLLDWLKDHPDLDGIKVVVMTADKAPITDARVAAVLRKPFNLDELIEVARKYCG